MEPRGREAMLIFDGDCGFCSAYARWAATRLGAGAAVLAWQDIDDLATVGLDRQDVDCAAW